MFFAKPNRISAAVWAILVLPVACASSNARAGDTIPLRIVHFNAEILSAPGVRAGTLNRYRFDDARRRHCERVADLIEVLRPDILNLVEVTSVEAVELIVSSLHEKGMTEYRGYHVESNDSFTGMDIAVISRLEPVSVNDAKIRTFFSAADDPEYRQAFSFARENGSTGRGSISLTRNSVYFFEVGGWRLGFLGLHLKANPDDPYSNARRMAEAEIVRRIVRSQIVGHGFQPVVLGDLNDYDPDVPDRDETRSTKTSVLADIKDYDPESPGDELVNVAARIARRSDRYTSHWDWNENGASDPQDVFTMLDHVLLPTDLMPYVERVFIAHVVSLETSDHFPVVVDLELPARVDRDE